MKISYLLFLSCCLYVSVYDVRGNVTNIVEEFKDHFKEYLKQESSQSTCFHFLKNGFNVCPCAIAQLQKIQEDFQNQNSIEVIMMKKNLQALIDQLKTTDKQPGKQAECKFLECHDPRTTVEKANNFFLNLRKRKCFKGSRK